jgi:hypothetical protein
MKKLKVNKEMVRRPERRTDLSRSSKSKASAQVTWQALQIIGIFILINHKSKHNKDLFTEIHLADPRFERVN